MFKDFFRYYVYPIAVMSGSIIGVGFLSLPYITMRVGALIMFGYFVALTALIVYLHVIFAKISLKTPDFKRFPGFARFYLGPWAGKVSLVLMVVGLLGVLLVYL